MASRTTEPAAGLAESIRRDVERNVLRARNGIAHVAGVNRARMGQTQKDTIWRSGNAQLWRYRGNNRRYGPPLLLVFSLVSRSYVLDLRPGHSFIEHLLDEGFDVYMVDWGVPDDSDADNTLETYVDDYLPRVVARVCATSQSDDITMLGYCLGGDLALLACARRPKLPVRNLITMATPIDWQQPSGLTSLLGRVRPDDVIDGSGNVPPEIISNMFRLLKPTHDVLNYANLWDKLWNDEFVEGYQAINQWSKDHVPLPGAFARQMSQLFSERNSLLQGRVPLGGRELRLDDITCPTLVAIAEKDHIVTVESAEVLPDLLGSDDVETLRLPAGHMALVIGSQAHKVTYPKLFDWLRRHET